MRSCFRAKILPLAITALLATTPVLAQDTSSAISGRVLDGSGQPVAGASVKIVHEPSGTTKTAITGPDGRYAAQGLRVGGPFDITVSKDGLAGAEQDNVYLQLAQESAINLVMEAGASAKDAKDLARVTVSASALAQTFSPDNKGISTNVTSREIEATPTPDRSIQNIVRLDPRIVITDRARGEFSAIGQNSRYNNVTVDSVSANDPFGLNANGLPTLSTPISQDTIEEYNISTANFDTAIRRGVGANVNAVTKSGTNDFHGSAYYVFQNQNMIGNNESGTKYAAFDRNWTGGGTIGGPIIKDKLFFFASMEKSVKVGAGSPYGPEDSGAASPIAGLTSAEVQQVLDAAKSLGLGDPGGYGGGNTNLQDKRYLAKIDWNISNDHRASFTYSQTKETKPVIGGSSTNLVLSSGWYTTNVDNKSYALHFYDDWSENFSSHASMSFAKFDQLRNPYNGVAGPDVTIYPSTFSDRNSVEFGTEYSSQANILRTRTTNLAWSGTYFAGDHAIKGGFDYERDNVYDLFLQNYYGSYIFEDGNGNSGLQNFLAGDYYQYRYSRPADGLGLNDVAASFITKQWGVFLQDTWQVSNALSLQYGLRIDIPLVSDKPIYNAAFAAAPGVNPVTGQATGGFGRTNQTTINGNRVVQPRASFNYNFDTELATQLRGGLGLFISNPPTVWIGNIYSNSGATVTGFNCGPTQSGPCSGTNLPPFSADPLHQNDGVAGSGAATVNTISPNFHLPSVWKFSLGLDKELPWWGLVATVDYEHIKVRDAILYQNYNTGAPTAVLPDGRESFYKNISLDPRNSGQRNRYLANPAFTANTINLANTGRGKGDSLALSLKKPFSNDWTGMLAFTWSRTTEVNPGTSSTASSNYGKNYLVNPNENVASPSNYSIPRRVLASLNWRHTFFGNYATSASILFDGHNAAPYSWTFGNDANGDSLTNDLVYIPAPGQVEFRNPTSQDKIDQFYDYIKSNDYLKSRQGKIAGRNGDRAGWINQVDLSFSQEIPGIFKGNKGLIKLDVYNFTNMLNKHWGIEKRVDFPGGRALADYYGVDLATGKYIYDISGSNYTDANGGYSPRAIPTYVNLGDDLAQRWSVSLTVKYTF
ncbi:MAG: carboxypeptidase regulatory-like domain-containing protein [Rhodanobacter sp.]